MIDGVLTFLKDELNSYLRVKTGGQAFPVVFLEERDTTSATTGYL